MDLEREKPKSITTAKVPRRTFLAGVAAGIGVALLPRGTRAQGFTPEQPIVDVAAAVAEAPLSPVEQLLANTELVDAVYLGHTPVAEFRTTPDSPFMISINPEVSEEDRNKFAELVGKSGQHFGYDTAEFIVMSDTETENDRSLGAAGYRYKGKTVDLGFFGTDIDKDSKKLIFKLGFSKSIIPYLNDTEFMSLALNSTIRGLTVRTIAKGDLSFMGGNDMDSALKTESQDLIKEQFIQFSSK